MLKIFWHELRTHKKMSGVVYMFPGLCSLSMISIEKNQYYGAVVYLLFFLSCLFIVICSPQVPDALFLAPFSKKMRISYVRKVYWSRIIIVNALNMIVGLVCLTTGIAAIESLILQFMLFIIISFHVGILDYCNSYKDTTDLEKIGCTFILVFDLLLTLVLMNLEAGDSMLWYYGISVISLLIGIYLIHIYRKFYSSMLDAYSDFEKYYMRPDPNPNAKKGARS